MKKAKLITLLGLSLLLVGCGGKTSASNTTTAPDSSDSTSNTQNVVTHNLTVDVTGEKTVGQVVTFVAKVDNSPVSQSKVTYTCSDSEAMTITANKATLNKAGTFTVSASYIEGDVTATATIEVVVEEDASDVISIQQALAAATDKPQAMTIRGVVTSLYGKGGTIDDGTGSIAVYSWYTSSTGSDTGISKHGSVYRLDLGEVVEIHGYVYQYSGVPQITGSYKKSDGTYDNCDGAYLKKVENSTIKARDVVELDEDGIKKLTNADAGKMVSFKATYVSGEPENVGDTVTFKVGNTNVYLETHKKEMCFDTLSDYWENLDIVANDEVTITTSFYELYNKKFNFGFYSYGTSIVLTTPHQYDAPTSVDVSSNTTSVEVGTTFTATAAVLPSTAKQSVVWSTSDDTIASVDKKKGIVFAKKAGTVTITATSKKNADIASSFNLTVTGDKEVATVSLTPDTCKTTTDFVLTNVAINSKYSNEFDISPTGKIVTAESLSDFVKLEVDVYGNYDNLKVYAGRETTGTAVSNTKNTGTNGYLYTYSFDKASGITITNSYSKAVNVFSLTAYYLK